MNPAGLRLRVVAALVLLIGACSGGGSDPTVADAYMPQPGAGAPGAFYLTITGGGEDDSIVGATSPACEQTVVHESIQGGDDGMMTMQPVEGAVPIPAGEEVAFEPGGIHVMCLQPDVEVGDTVLLTLSFAEAGDIALEATVQER